MKLFGKLSAVLQDFLMVEQQVSMATEVKTNTHTIINIMCFVV